MFISEFYQMREDGVRLIRTYSDAGFMIRRERDPDPEPQPEEEYSGTEQTDEPADPAIETDTGEEAAEQSEAPDDLYVEAIDVEDSGNTYTETDIPVNDEISDEEALRILLGGDADETA